MRILAGVLLLAVAAAALPEEREVAAAKQKIQAMLDEAALLDQAGRHDEAERVRAQAMELKAKLQGGGGKEGDDPRIVALHNLEKAIGALDKAGYEGMARELNGMADRLRGEIKGRGGEGPRREKEVEFWGRNMDTLRIAAKGLAEAEKKDAVEMMERAIRAREMVVKGRTDAEAQEFMRKGPNDGNLCELLLMAGKCWRGFNQADKAERCEELARHLQGRMEKERAEKTVRAPFGPGREGPGPDDRLAQLEERLNRMERMLAETLQRLEERDRQRDRDRDRDRGGR